MLYHACFCILLTVLWFMAATFCTGVMLHWDPDEWEDMLPVLFFMNLCMWWFWCIALIGIWIFKSISKPSMAVAGFLDRVFDGGKDDDFGGEKEEGET